MPADTIVRVSPDNFPELPASIRTGLTRRGCSIPQPFDARSRHQNVIRGAFTEQGATDWAVLCSRRMESSILVYRTGDAGPFAELASQPDSDYMQDIGGGHRVFSRRITVATPARLRRSKANGGEGPPVISHAGIEDAFLEKASVVWYRYAGEWLRLTGAD